MSDTRINTEDENSPLSLEAQRLSLEREQLKLAQERLAEREAEFEALCEEQENAQHGDVLFSKKLILAAAVVLFILGGFVGLGIGIDIGRKQSPKPQRVMVSRAFVRMMNSINGIKPAEFDQTPPPPPFWQESRRNQFPEDLIIVR